MNEAKDSLRSKAVLTLVDLLGEGPIGGPVGAAQGKGLQSVFLNDTPLQNADGTMNFQGVTADWRNGDNDQTVMPYFGNYVEAPFNIGVNVKYGQPYTFPISNPSADAVRIIVSIPSLTYTDSGTGDIYGTTVQYKFSMSTDDGASWFDVTAGFEWANAGTWAFESGYLTATAPAGYLAVSAKIRGAAVNLTQGWVDVQAQELSKGVWSNLGTVRRINVTYVNLDSTIFNGSDEYVVQSATGKVRFIVVGQSEASMNIEQVSIQCSANVPTLTVGGKSRSRYQRAHVLRITPGVDTLIRMTRLTPDSTSSLLQNETYLESYSEVVTLNMAYPNSAVFGIRIDSQQFNQLPNRSYLVDGLAVRVPANYNTTTRSYNGVWDGTLVYGFTDNPAWILFDLLTNKRYGLGNFLADSQIDKAALYTIGRYCDGVDASGNYVGVPNGFGGMEPRFTINTVISSQAEAFKLVSDITSVFRGMCFWSGGMVMFTQDSPSDSSMIYTPSNVIEGLFTYTGSARKDRHSVVHVTWNDPDDYYKRKVEYVEDPELIAQYGVKRLDTVAFGCTSRGQAHRVGKWILYTERYESDFVTFKVGLDSAFVMPGQVIKIHDTTRAGKRMGGRIVSVTANTAVLDSPVTLQAAGATISLMMPDGTFVDRPLAQSAGTYTSVAWTTPLTQLPLSNGVWLISEATLVPMLARVIGVTAGENATEFEITAVEHNPSKFAAIEQNVALEARKTSIIDPSFVQVPTQLTATQSVYVSAPGVLSNRIHVTWFSNSTTHELSWRGISTANLSNWNTVTVNGALTYEIDNVALGVYEIKVVGINPLGKRSTVVSTTVSVAGKTSLPSDVTTAFAVPNPNGVELSWVPVTDVDVAKYEIRQCTTLGQDWTLATPLGIATTPVYQVPMLTSGATYQWLIKAIDSFGRLSANAARVQAILVTPGATTPTYSYSNSDIVLAWAAPTVGALPIKEYEVRVGAAFSSATVIGTTTDTSYRLRYSWATSQTFWVSAVDTSGTKGSAGSVVATFNAPSAVVITQSAKTSNFTLSWSASASSFPIASYEVRTGTSYAGSTLVSNISATQVTVPMTWLGDRKYWVTPVDVNGNYGTPASATLTIAGPNTPVVTGSISSGNVALSWSDSAATLPIDYYEVRRGVNFAAGTTVAKVYATTVSIPVDWTGSQTFNVAAVDINGNWSAPAQYIASITAPGAVAPSAAFQDRNLVLTWGAPSTGSLAIKQYEVRVGTTWATAAVVGFTPDRTYSIPVNWTSTQTFWVAAIDTVGGYSTPGSVTATYSKYGSVSALSAAINQSDAVLTWNNAVGGSLPIDYYDVRFGGTFSSGQILARVTSNTLTLPVTWLGARQLWVTPVDTMGQYGTETSVTVTVNAPSAPSASSKVVVAKAELTWTVPNSTIPIREYEIRYGTDFATGTLVATTLATNYRAPIDFFGSRTYWIAARDVNGNTGVAGSTVVSVSAAAAPALTGTFILDEFKLEWTAVQGTLPTDQYEVRYGTSWAAGTSVGLVGGTTFSTKAQWAGSRTWWVAAIDVNGNVGAAGSKEMVVNLPPAPTINPQVVDNNVLLYWTEVQGTLPTITYDIRRGATYATSVSLGRKSGGFTTVFETAAGLYTYWVVAVDSAGNIGTPASIVARVDQPPDYVLQLNRDSDFNGRNFEFSAAGNAEGWAATGANITVSGDVLTVTSTSTDPIIVESLSGEFFYGCERPTVFMRIRRVAGTGWQGDLYYSTAGHSYSESYKKTVAVGPTVGQTLTLAWDMTTLSAGGTDWMDNRITAVRFDLGTSTADVFEIEYIRFCEYSGTNTLLEESNTLVMPVNTTETFASHFTSRAWAGPSAQVAAGYPLFIQPTTTPGTFTQIIDYGALLPATKVTVTPTATVLAGTPTITYKLSVRATTADAWTDYAGQQSIYASGFRYVKVEIIVTNADSLGLVRLSNVNIKFDSKLKNDAGMGVAAATDAVTGTSAVINGVTVAGANPPNAAGVSVPNGAGTLVRVNQSFVDISSIDVSVAAGGTATTALYDFQDVANPAGFKVLLLDAAGNRVGGSFSWSVKGY